MTPTAPLLVLAAVWTSTLAAPLEAGYLAPDAETPPRAISDIIQDANYDVSIPLMDGDIAQSLGRSAQICQSCKWPMENGVVKVPYVISSNYSDSDTRLLRSAFQEFSSMTCIKFVNRTNEKNFLSVVSGSGCWSYIGKIGGAQTVNLQKPYCLSYGVVQHELMHALNFFHEHNREDRDNYVKIMWQNISPQNQGDFMKKPGNSLSVPYNYNSVLHYSNKTFSNTSGKPSLEPKPDPTVSIGQRYGLSGPDITLINRFYSCNLCRTKLLGSFGNFSSSDASPSRANDNCLWLLHVPSNKVFLQFNSFISSRSHCAAKIIVYDGVDKTSPILATIGPNRAPAVLISSGIFLLVEYIANVSCPSSFTASYSTVTSGATFTQISGSVVSLKYPNFYPNNARDTSVIVAPAGYIVSLNFTLFDLEPSPACTNDFLVVRDGGDTSAPVLGTYCGKKSRFQLLSSGPMVLLQFSSNNQSNRRGYKADYTFVSSGGEENRR